MVRYSLTRTTVNLENMTSDGLKGRAMSISRSR
jgi:hypothetical protein